MCPVIRSDLTHPDARGKQRLGDLALSATAITAAEHAARKLTAAGRKPPIEWRLRSCEAGVPAALAPAHPFGGSVRANATPCLTQPDSWRLVASPRASTRIQPAIARPRI